MVTHIEPPDADERRTVADTLAREVMSRWPGKDLDRVMEGLDVWCYRKPARVHKGQRAVGFHVPGLPDEPWIDPAAFGCGDILTDGGVISAVGSGLVADGAEVVARVQSEATGGNALEQGQTVGLRFAPGAVQVLED